MPSRTLSIGTRFTKVVDDFWITVKWSVDHLRDRMRETSTFTYEQHVEAAHDDAVAVLETRSTLLGRRRT